MKRGGKITVGSLKDLVESTYKTDLKEYKGYIRDNSLSTEHTKVYYNPQNKVLIVAERPTHTGRDVISDIIAGLDVTGKIFKLLDSRYRKSFSTFIKALNKYSDRKFSILIGYSLGAIVSDHFSRDHPDAFDDIILVSTPELPSDILNKLTPVEKATKIKASLDPVGLLGYMRDEHLKSDKEIIIPSTTFDPRKEHQIKHWLSKVDQNLEIGNDEVLSGIGINFRKMKVAELREYIKTNRKSLDGFRITGVKKSELVKMAERV